VEDQVSVAHHHIIPQARIMGLQVHLMEVGMGIGQGMVEVREPWPDQSLEEYAHFSAVAAFVSTAVRTETHSWEESQDLVRTKTNQSDQVDPSTPTLCN
jgi:hypothetical protein